MPYEQLIESVEMCADDKIREIKEKAAREAAEMKKEAAGKDEIIKKRHHEAARRAVENERSKSIAQIKKETRMQLIRVKDAVFQKAFIEAQKQFLSAREQANYENSFRKLLEEVVVELGGETIQLRIDKRDEGLCKKLLQKLNLTCGIVADITTAGGLNASTNDGRFVVFNTIESRSERAKVLLKPEIFATLYGGQGGV
jgi:V/A-type H+-transporting ATPase subunit E